MRGGTASPKPVDETGTGASEIDAQVRRPSIGVWMGRIGRPLWRSPLAACFAFTGLGATLAVIGYWMLFSRFALWDDEGYVLISARDYLAQGGLYESVYSQYGPAFYCVIEVLAKFGFVADHTSARLFTLACWLGAAASCASMVWRQTRSLALGTATLSGTFLYLYFLPDEPFHPGALIVLIVAASLFFASEFVRRQQLGKAMIVLGATSAVLAMTKVNVGAFYASSCGSWLLLHATTPARRNSFRWLVPAALVSGTIAMMSTLLHEHWVQLYVLLFAVGAVALSEVATGSGVIRPRHFAIASATALLTGVAIAGWMCARGTSFATLCDGIIAGPSRHARSYSYPVDWRPGTVGSAVLSLGAVFALPWIRSRGSAHVADAIIVGLRLTQAAALAVGLMMILHGRVIGAVFSFVAPLIWTWVVPLSRAPLPTSDALARTLLAFTLLMQFLHGYPVGGSQESWGTFLIVPLVALGLGDLQRWAPATLSPRAAARRGWSSLAAALTLLLIVKAALVGRVAHATYSSRTALGLPGAELLRLDDTLRTAYRILAQNIAAHADPLFSMPGLFSFNLWTEVAAPTRRNTTLWFTLLNQEEQREIITALERSPRACVIVQKPLLASLRAGSITASGPLADYISTAFTPAFELEGFTFLVRRGRQIAPVGLVRLTHDMGGASPMSDLRAELCLAGDDSAIAAIEIADPTQPQVTPVTLDGRTTAVTLTGIDSAGRATTPTTDVTWPIRFKGAARLSFRVHPRCMAWSRATTFRLKTVDGAIIAEARIFQ